MSGVILWVWSPSPHLLKQPQPTEIFLASILCPKGNCLRHWVGILCVQDTARAWWSRLCVVVAVGRKSLFSWRDFPVPGQHTGQAGTPQLGHILDLCVPSPTPTFLFHFSASFWNLLKFGSLKGLWQIKPQYFLCVFSEYTKQYCEKEFFFFLNISALRIWK